MGAIESTRSPRPDGRKGTGEFGVGGERDGATPSHRPYAVGLPCPLPPPPRRILRAIRHPPARPHLSRRRCARPGRGSRRPHVDRLPRRPGAPLRRIPHECDGPRAAERVDRAEDAGRVAQGRSDASGERVRPVRPGLPVRRHRRVHPERAAARHGGADHALGHPAVGERRPEAAGDAPEHRRLPELRPRGREPLLGPVLRLSVRPLLLDLERVEPRDVPRPAVRRRRAASSARATTRGSPRRATPASRPATHGRRSRSARRPRTDATRSGPASRTPSRRPRS